MYWSNFDADTNRRLLRDVGFSVIEANVEQNRDEDALWVIAES